MYQKLSVFKLMPGQRGRSGIRVQLWWIIQSIFFSCTPQFMYSWRCFLLRCFGAKIGCNVIIRSSARVTYPWKLEVGDNAWIGDDVVLYNWSPICIENNAVISQRSYLCTATHNYTDPAFSLTSQPITIREQAWVATDCFIAPGVTIGKGAVIGSRSSVYKDMPEGMICVGSPAKPVKPRLIL